MNATQRTEEIQNRSDRTKRTVRLWCKDEWRDFQLTECLSTPWF